MARLPVRVDYGSEFRYRDPVMDDQTAGAGHHPVGRDGGHPGGHGRGPRARARTWLSIVNVIGSQAARLADSVIYMHAGPEIGVASTKAFTASVVDQYLLAV